MSSCSLTQGVLEFSNEFSLKQNEKVDVVPHPQYSNYIPCSQEFLNALN